MRWLLTFLIFQGTAFADISPNWTPYSYPGLPQSTAPGPSLPQGNYQAPNIPSTPAISLAQANVPLLPPPLPIVPLLPMPFYPSPFLSDLFTFPLTMGTSAQGLDLPDDMIDDDHGCESCKKSQHLPLADHIEIVPEPFHYRADSYTEGGALGTPSRGSDRVATSEAENVSRPAATPPPPPTARPQPKDEDDDHPVDTRLGSPEKALLRPHNRAEANSQTQPVWEKFADEFRACAPQGCEPYDYAAQSDRHDHGLSCHNSGRAIDVHAMACPGQVSGRNVMVVKRAINSQEFANLVSCVQRRRQMIVLFHNKPWNGGANITQGHYDHAHFSIGCHNGKYW